MLRIWWIAAAKGSMNITNKEGESGHPFRVPLCKVKLSNVIPLVVTLAEGALYRIFIQLINDSPKPNFCNVLKRNFQFTRSNALSACILLL